MQTHTVTTYSFAELSDEAKAKAIDNHRDYNVHDEWFDYVYENAKEIGKILGIEISRIYFSGFCSQGSGACFEGEYSYAKGSTKAIREYASEDKELHDLADRLRDIQRPLFYGLYAYITHRGHHMHSGCTDIDVREDKLYCDALDDDIEQCLREFMDWIYKRLEEEYDALRSDEAVREALENADYMEFLADGSDYYG